MRTALESDMSADMFNHSVHVAHTHVHLKIIVYRSLQMRTTVLFGCLAQGKPRLTVQLDSREGRRTPGNS